MNLRGVVIPIDPFEGFPLDVTLGFPWPDLVVHLGLEEADDAFSQGVVIGVTDRSDWRVDLGLGQARSILDRQIL